jgi:hypothetical protein
MEFEFSFEINNSVDLFISGNYEVKPEGRLDFKILDGQEQDVTKLVQNLDPALYSLMKLEIKVRRDKAIQHQLDKAV